MQNVGHDQCRSDLAETTQQLRLHNGCLIVGSVSVANSVADSDYTSQQPVFRPLWTSVTSDHMDVEKQAAEMGGE